MRVGHPSNNLSEVGLTIHCFDGMEGGQKPFLPCTTGWCKWSGQWWSSSIIGPKHRATFGDSGIVFDPESNAVLCSGVTDFGSNGRGCQNLGKSRGLYGPNATDQMLGYSNHWGNMYNEVLIDSRQYVSNLPRSVAAFVYGLAGNSLTFDKVKAVHAYLSFLRTYNLNEGDVPLLRAKFSPDEKTPIAADDEDVFVDESASARAFLRAHPMARYQDRWRKHHPYLAKHPELMRETLSRKRRESHEQATAGRWFGKKETSTALLPQG
jgi:hypothetical protein